MNTIHTNVKVYTDNQVSENHNIITNYGLTQLLKSPWAKNLNMGSGNQPVNANITTLNKPAMIIDGVYSIRSFIDATANTVRNANLLRGSKANGATGQIISEVGIGLPDALVTYSLTKNGIGEIGSVTLLPNEILRVDYTVDLTVPYKTENDVGTVYIYQLPSIGVNPSVSNKSVQFNSGIPDGLLTEADLGIRPTKLNEWTQAHGSQLTINNGNYVITFTEQAMSGKKVQSIFVDINGLIFLVVYKEPLTFTGGGTYTLKLPIPTFKNTGA